MTFATYETLDHVSRRPPRIHVAVSLTIVALAALILNPLFGSRAALLFLLAGSLLVISKPFASMQVLVRHWYLFALPAFCALSVLWSDYPSNSLRHSIQLALTIAVAIVIAGRVAPIAFVRCLFWIYGFGVVGSLLFGRVRDDIGAWIGIFGSKNAFAGVITGFALAALAIVFDRGSPWPIRWGAAGGLLVCGPLLILAQSTGAMTLIVPALGVGITVLLLRRLPPLLLLLAGGFTVCIGIIAAAFLVIYGETLMSGFLNLSGKDDTLTGRTDLWEVAMMMIADRPWLGVGYQAFWVHGNIPAEVLWDLFGIASRSGFNFHNTYLSNAVEIGIIGVGIQVLMLYGAFFGVLVWALRSPSPESAFFAAFMTQVICTSFLEVTTYFQFSIVTIIAICALVYAMQHRRHHRRQARRDAERSPHQLVAQPIYALPRRLR